MSEVTLRECFARDGLQHEPAFLRTVIPAALEGQSTPARARRTTAEDEQWRELEQVVEAAREVRG